MNPEISIVTVVYNSVLFIEKTILSVLSQTYSSKEHIMIDGNSDDGTKEILKSYQKYFSVFISEEDQGIYDAMNKGLRMAKGQYVLFLNSGDELYEANTLEKISPKNTEADVIYGETLVIDQNGKILGKRSHIPKQLKFHSFRFGTTVSHQAFIVKKEICPFYSTQMLISSDVDWMLNILKKKPVVFAHHFYVSKYLHGGINKQKHWIALKERFWIMVKHYGMIATVLQHVVIVSRFIFNKLAKRKSLK